MNEISTYVESLPEIKGKSAVELGRLVESLGEKAYRGRQIYDGLYISRYAYPGLFSGLSVELRDKLEQECRFDSVSVGAVRESIDGTIKLLFSLYDGRSVESVIIPSEMRGEQGMSLRRTLCVSTQVGCNLGCVFCATATLTKARNLTAGEIIDQYLQASGYASSPITNLVFMGMGEPLNNYDNVMNAVAILNDQRTRMVAPRRTTLSTAGVVPGIIRMADDNLKIKLAISLHAPTQEQRQQIMPIARRWPLNELMEAVDYYYKRTRKSVTLEYILFKDFNDSDADVRRLARLCRRAPIKLNVIPFHDISFTKQPRDLELKPASPERFEEFIQQMRDEGVFVYVRSSSGHDIEAACGQLALSKAD